MESVSNHPPWRPDSAMEGVGGGAFGRVCQEGRRSTRPKLLFVSLILPTLPVFCLQPSENEVVSNTLFLFSKRKEGGDREGGSTVEPIIENHETCE